MPLDTMAVVSAKDLLGGNYMRLDPDGEENVVGPGGRLIYTQDAADIIGLFSQVIYNPRENN